MRKIKVLSGLMAALMGILSFSSLPSVDAKDLDAKKAYYVKVSKEDEQKFKEVLEKMNSETRTNESDSKSVGFIAKVRDFLDITCSNYIKFIGISFIINSYCERDSKSYRISRKFTHTSADLAIYTGVSSMILKILS